MHSDSGRSATSLVLDHYGWFQVAVHALNVWLVGGTILMIAGIFLIVKN